MPYPVVDPALDDEGAIRVTVQHLAPVELLPMVTQNATHDFQMTQDLGTIIQQIEHVGCTGSRLVGLHAVTRASKEPSDALTVRPAALGPPEPLMAAPPTSAEAEHQRDDDAMALGSDPGSDHGYTCLRGYRHPPILVLTFLV